MGNLFLLNSSASEPLDASCKEKNPSVSIFSINCSALDDAVEVMVSSRWLTREEGSDRLYALKYSDVARELSQKAVERLICVAIFDQTRKN